MLNNEEVHQNESGYNKWNNDFMKEQDCIQKTVLVILMNNRNIAEPQMAGIRRDWKAAHNWECLASNPQ
ncbi:hypothetical protein [Peribacillus frigoritolerans]|uniref:hypothetical protein n=1 Tax=Peribacillus frigoritolerans TaxID=450367 RepID=UPI0021AA07E5|nr:hypothetical protein [Peribacillus frigoritolerans]